MGLFANKKAIVGMLHLLPLPQSPAFTGSISNIFNHALEEADILVDEGIDALIIENFNDKPYRISEPEISQICVISNIVNNLKRLYKIPIGVNILLNAWKAEMAIAYACLAEFIRVEVFIDTVISPSGIVNPCAPDLLRLQKTFGSSNVEIWADIQTKTTKSVIDKNLQQSAIEAEKVGASVIIVTGSATGQATPLEKIKEVKKVTKIPVYVGSGVNAENVPDILSIADGLIVGSALKEGFNASNKVSRSNTKRIISAANRFMEKKTW